MYGFLVLNGTAAATTDFTVNAEVATLQLSAQAVTATTTAPQPTSVIEAFPSVESVIVVRNDIIGGK